MVARRVRGLPRTSIIFLSASLVLLGARAEEVGPVVSLKDGDEFLRRMQSTERMAVMFFAPWCEHCKTLDPEFQLAASNMKSEDLLTVMASIDGSKEDDSLKKKYGIEEFPMVPYFVWGKQQGFFKAPKLEGSSAGMMALFKKWERHSIAETPAEHYDTFLENTPSGQFAVIARVKEGSARAKAYQEAVNEMLKSYEVSHFRFAVVWLPKTADPKRDATLSVLRAGFEKPEETLVAYAGGWTGANIARWVKQSAYPDLGTAFDGKKHSHWAIQDMHLDGVVVAITDSDEVKLGILEAVRPLAAEFKSWCFTSADPSQLQEIQRRKLGVLGQKSWPAIVVVLSSPECTTGSSHCFDTQLFLYKDVSGLQSTSAIRSFLDSVKEKRAPRTYRSALLPTGLEGGRDADGTSVLVGDTFERDVFDSTSDVLVFFYSPNSTRCEDFRVEWGKLAKEVVKRGWASQGVILAKIDASNNESPEESHEVPKLVLYLAVEARLKLKKRRIYSGKLQTEAIADFLLDNARNLGDAEEL